MRNSWSRYRGMRLSTRLLLIVLTCLVPIMALAVWVEFNHWSERRMQLGDLALQQAELLNGDVDSIVDGARILLTAVAEFRTIREHAPECAARLVTIQPDLPSFAFIALLDNDGQLICASKPGVEPAPGERPKWIQNAVAAKEFSVGRFAKAPGFQDGFLPIVLPLSAIEPHRNGVLVAALDLRRLSEHLAQLKQTGSPFLAGSVLSVADRDGYILARAPQHDEFVGKQLPPIALPLVTAPQAGIARLKSIDGTERVIGYVPVTQSPYSLMVAIGFYEPDMMGDINQATLRGSVLLGIVAFAAFVLTLFIARRFISRPTRELLAAAHRWREGDLATPVQSVEQRSEFGQIAAAYNDMAGALARREEQLREHADELEARVADRTQELLVSNNRLQVEIAERENTEAALVQSQKLQAVGQLAGGIAHDFNNLLATIQGSLDLLARAVAPEQTKQHRWIERASGAVSRGAQLTGRLLAFSRRQRLVVEASDVNKLISDLVPLLGTCTRGHQIRIETVLAARLWPAMVESSQVEAAILNLALNARDAMPQGGVLTIATSNKVISDQANTDVVAGDYVAITVSDTGVGMTEEVVKRAFEPFFTTKGPSGSGLGLSQVYGVAKESGGSVSIESAPDRGTSVTLLLPRATDLPKTDRPHLGEGQTGTKLRLLVVDDDQDVLQVTADMLKQLGYCVTEAQSGEEALTYLDSPPDIVILDYAMPSMTGLEVAAAMRTQGFTGPIILATGYAELRDVEQFNPDKLQGVLNKPYTIRDLESLLARVEHQVRQNSVADASLETAK